MTSCLKTLDGFRNALSRASRRKAEPTGVALEKLCAGAPDATVALDEATATELQAAVPPGALSSVEASAATIAWPVAGLDGSPLMALTGSLSTYAGGAVEALACLEIALARYHGSLQVSAGHVEVRIPLVTADEHE